MVSAFAYSLVLSKLLQISFVVLQGVSGLWAEIKPVAVRQSFEKTAFQVFDEAYEELLDGHPIPKGTTLGLRVGIDASAWFIHSEKADGGANAALRNMFHRVIRLKRAGVRALFVFDGPHRPSVKRGRRIYRGANSMQSDFERIVEAFGFEWRIAPGEAEAELAYLNRRGTLDLVITDDVDCLLFGAGTLLKHALINQPTESIHPQLYERGTIELELDLTVSGLILVALMSGGDYDTGGLTGMGPKISLALAKAGFGERLQMIMSDTKGKEMQAHLQALRDEIRHEMRTNQSGYFERKAGAVANKFHDNWPDIGVANSYYNAITTELPKYKHFDKEHLWNRKIDVPALVAILDDLFEFIHAEILQKLRSQIWECMVVQDLIWRIRDNGVSVTESPSPADTPSKALTASLGSVTLHSPAKDNSDKDQAPLVVPHRIEKKRARLKEHVTDELQLIVDPSSTAVVAQACLRHPDPNIGKLEARKAEEAAAIRAVHGPDHPGAVPAPPRNSHFDHPHEVQKLWIQESLLRMALPNMVKDWEEREQAKLDAKANKGKKASTKTSPKKSQESSKSKSSTPTKARRKPAKAKQTVDSDSEPERPTALSRTASEDVFGSPASAPVSAELQKSNSDPIPPKVKRKAPISIASYKRSKEEKESSSSSSSGSDIEIIAGGKAAVGKSPKKSPRRGMGHTTARNVGSTEADAPSVPAPPIVPFHVLKKASEVSKTTSSKLETHIKAKAKPEVPKKQYTYRDLLDTTSESSEDELPALTRLLKHKDKDTSAGKDIAAAKTRPKAEINRETSVPVARPKPKPVKSVNKSASQPAVREVIDLCSSD